MDARTHLAIGWIYFAAAWLSLFLINGILDFMLASGAWLADGSFWSGFFNSLFWPSLGFRTAVCCLLAGVYAFLTTAFLKDRTTQRAIARFSGRCLPSTSPPPLTESGTSTGFRPRRAACRPALPPPSTGPSRPGSGRCSPLAVLAPRPSPW